TGTHSTSIPIWLPSEALRSQSSTACARSVLLASTSSTPTVTMTPTVSRTSRSVSPRLSTLARPLRHRCGARATRSCSRSVLLSVMLLSSPTPPLSSRARPPSPPSPSC
ncbi:hypothetical protein BGZ97_006360, partial [Linnemannia gamsii]